MASCLYFIRVSRWLSKSLQYCRSVDDQELLRSFLRKEHTHRLRCTHRPKWWHISTYKDLYFTGAALCIDRPMTREPLLVSVYGFIKFTYRDVLNFPLICLNVKSSYTVPRLYPPNIYRSLSNVPFTFISPHDPVPVSTPGLFFSLYVLPERLLNFLFMRALHRVEFNVSEPSDYIRVEIPVGWWLIKTSMVIDVETYQLWPSSWVKLEMC